MMRDNSDCKISDLLPKQFDHMEDAVSQELAEDPEFSRKRWPGFVRRIIAAKATKAVLSALDKSVFTIFPAAWSRAPELADYADPNTNPHDVETTLFLGEHKFEIDYKPVVNVNIMNIQRPLLRFQLVLSPQIRGASITVRNGHIVSIGECDCAVEAELRYLVEVNGKLEPSGFHTKLKSRDIKLAAPVELKPPGVPIVRTKSPASPVQSL